MREIVFDTETTGLDPAEGHRLVEIGCLELIRGVPSGQTWHRYVNPDRDMPDEAFAVHGLSRDFLADKPLFEQVADEFLAFVGEARLVAHNAAFDIRFINAELQRVGRPPLPAERVIDTLVLARRKHPGARLSLDELCQRYGIDNSCRTKHGALLDAELLADVYIELTGGRQTALGLQARLDVRPNAMAVVRQRPVPLAPRLSAEERAAHQAFVATLGEAAIWHRYRT